VSKRHATWPTPLLFGKSEKKQKLLKLLIILSVDFEGPSDQGVGNCPTMSEGTLLSQTIYSGRKRAVS
jgi:hypothetical protein